MKIEKGGALLETIVALAILGFVAVMFLSSVNNSSTARVTADERVSAKILAESLIDNIKKQSFESDYTVTVPVEFSGYTAHLTVTSLANGNIQKLSITIGHFSKDVLTLESLKVDRNDS
jgi:type II secretory pathway pseudopilin PulG